MGVNIKNAMPWNELKQLMIGENCRLEKMQKLEQELWNLTMQEADVGTYTSCFNDLVTLCPMMVIPEEKKIERYI